MQSALESGQDPDEVMKILNSYSPGGSSGTAGKTPGSYSATSGSSGMSSLFKRLGTKVLGQRKTAATSRAQTQEQKEDLERQQQSYGGR